MNEIMIKVLIVLVLCLCFYCTEVTYKEETICYDLCLQKGLYVAVDNEHECKCVRLKE